MTTESIKQVRFVGGAAAGYVAPKMPGLGVTVDGEKYLYHYVQLWEWYGEWYALPADIPKKQMRKVLMDDLWRGYSEFR